MDEMTLLRELESDPEPLTRESRAAARMRLSRAVEGVHRRRTVRVTRPSPAAALATVLAVAVTAVAAVAVVDRDSAQPRASRVPLASAAPVLYRAAAQARREPGLTWRDDQFLYTRQTMTEKPVDGRGRTLTFTNEYWRAVDGSKPSLVIERGRTWTEAPVDPSAVWPPRTAAALEALPTEPDALLDAVHDWFGRAESQDVDYVTEYMALTMMLDRELTPALRAATFEALARIPGVEVSDDEVDAHGRRGIGIRRPAQPAGAGKVIVLDRDTYEFLGLRETTTRPDGTRIHLLVTHEARGVVDQVRQRP
jgi:hypothetical protein